MIIILFVKKILKINMLKIKIISQIRIIVIIQMNIQVLHTVYVI